MTTRTEHLDWCKKRAFEILDTGDVGEAYASMCSDLQKHSETVNHVGIELGLLQVMGGMLSNVNDMRHFIDGFN